MITALILIKASTEKKIIILEGEEVIEEEVEEEEAEEEEEEVVSTITKIINVDTMPTRIIIKVNIVAKLETSIEAEEIMVRKNYPKMAINIITINILIITKSSNIITGKMIKVTIMKKNATFIVVAVEEGVVEDNIKKLDIKTEV